MKHKQHIDICDKNVIRGPNGPPLGSKRLKDIKDVRAMLATRVIVFKYVMNKKRPTWHETFMNWFIQIIK